MKENPCVLKSKNKLHECPHSLHHRKTTSRCSFICSNKEHKKKWCDVIHNNLKKNKKSLLPTNHNISFLKATAASSQAFK